MTTHTYGPGPIKAYDIGPIPMEAAFTSDFPLAAGIGAADVQDIVDKQEVERRVMDVRTGMYAKYMPSRIDEAAGRHYTGGRYLFETWADVVDYERFTSQELEFEPGVKFWSRPFFQDVERFVWRVAGAHNFLPLDAHHVSRFERFRYEGDGEAALERAWGTVRDEAGARGLAAVWLLHQPEQRLIGLHTVATGLTPADLEAAPSLGALLPASLAPERYFDRSSRILSLWLPKSRLAGGAPSAYPSAPLLPLPSVAAQEV
ncbi:hypothetical protein [Streptomyces alboflavus]|uniref:hypothetical protein n=1 Tax=Streptomyces alboflavus TaxID=67267 RepID=UPI0004C00362|nr:hypothetical protein [Streptomyces alboflavus]